jgi:hypothetical protein
LNPRPVWIHEGGPRLSYDGNTPDVEHRKGSVKTPPSKAMMILIAGPYRSGTNDDPALMKRNVEEMESYALAIFRAGHIPILGEWLALPLVRLGGSRKVGDEIFSEVFHPIAIRILEKCDAVLRVGGQSAGADEMVRIGRSLGLAIYNNAMEIPKVG